MADIVSYNERESSFRSPPANSGLHANPPPTGLVLPKVHLGSFGAMDIDYFDTVGRSPGDLEHKRLQEQTDGGLSRGGNAESYYGLTSTGGPSPSPTSPLLRQRSMSSEGRVWKPRSSASTTVGAGASSSSPQQQQPSVSPPAATSPLNAGNSSIYQATLDAAPVPSSSTPPLDPTASDSPRSASPRSLSYLPPGAASPQHFRGSGMAGIGSMGWAAGAAVAASMPSRASPPQDPSRSRSTRTQTASPDPQAVSAGEYNAAEFDRRSPLLSLPPNDADRTQGSYNQNGTSLGPRASPPAQRGDIPIALQQNQYNPPTSPAAPAPRPLPPGNQASPYPSFPSQAPISPQPVTLAPPVETRQSQPQTRGGPRAAAVVVEEVCIECMMRDRDMADVDVTGSGAWERESDVWYNELVRKDEEDEMRARVEGLPPPSTTNQSGKQRPKSKGGRLTEPNVKIWLTLNPKEPQARWQTLEAYLKSQSALLVAEAAARAQTQRESRQVDNRLRESYSQIRRSGYETTLNPRNSGGSITNGIQVRVAPSPTQGVRSPEKDVTLLENGLIVDHVDLKKEEKEAKARMRSLERNERQKRRMSSTGLNDAASGYDQSIYSAPSPTFAPNGHPSPYGMPSQSSVQLSPGPDKRFSVASGQTLNSPRPPMQRVASQASVETTGTGVRRFFGYKHGGGASQASLAISGSMMDMHIGLEQDRRAYAYANQDLPHDFSAPPTVEFGGPETVYLEPDQILGDDRSSTAKSKKKSKTLGKIWKIMTGQKDSGQHSKGKASHSAPMEDDLSAPLAPPPPLSFLVSGRSDRAPQSRHMSSPSLSGGMSNHPRSTSAPSQSATGISPPTAPSSLLPSPTSNRFPWRDSGSDDPRSHKDDAEVDLDTQENRMDGPRQRAASAVGMSTQPSFNRNSVASGASRGYSIDKTLPPLPPPHHDSSPLPFSHAQTLRPSTYYGNNQQDAHNLVAPNAPFRNDVRRQSFSGVTNKLGRQSWMPNDAPAPFAPPPPVGARYDEFGGSRRSLGKFEDMRGRPDRSDDSGSMSKRASSKSRSRFFGSLFSANKKQSSLPPTIYLGPSSSATLAPLRPFDHHTREHSTSHSSYYSSDIAPANRSNMSHNNPSVNSWHNRTSVASSRKLALVTQDEDFVAYRYPSQSQTLPMHR